MLALQNFKTLIEEGFNEIVADSDDFRVSYKLSTDDIKM